MILSFKDQFVSKIIKGTKIHTIRLDPHNRWKPGNKIHFATGLRTKNYKQFFEGECKSIQSIKIIWLELAIYPKVFVDNKQVDPFIIEKLSMNDGFDNSSNFRKWFIKDFEGKIIHWTNYKY